MKRRVSLWTVMGASALTAVAVAMLIVWLGGVRPGHSVDVMDRPHSRLVRPAAWFEAQPASFADLAEKVQGSVVNISSSKRIRRPRAPFPYFGPRDPFFDDFFEKFFEGVPQEQTQHSLGSGFVIDEKGTILTNNHVVSQAEDIEVTLSGGHKYKAKVIGVDEKTDIAVIQIEAKKPLPCASLGSSKNMRAGDWVMAIGNPFGLEHTVTVGVISAKGRLIGGGPYAKFIQTDASINPGNSGGPLFNMKGEVIGINTMIFAGGQGIGFAIPIDLAKAMIPDLVEKGVVSRGWLGVAIQDVTPELAKSFGLEEDEGGALIAEVYSNSPAAKAGFRRGDVVIEFNGEKVTEPYDLSLFVGQTKPGTRATAIVLREGKRKELKIKVGKQEKGVAAAEPEERDVGKADALGLVVHTISAEDVHRLDVPSDFRGVVVARVEPGSAAERSNVRAGDVILEINEAKIESLDDYNKAVGKLTGGSLVRLFIKRGKASIYLAFRL